MPFYAKNRGIFSTVKQKFRHIEKYSEGDNYSNKEKRLHYPAEAIQMFDNKSPQLYTVTA